MDSGPRYGGLLEQPGDTRATARRKRRRVLLATAILLTTAVLVGIAVARSGLVGDASTNTRSEPATITPAATSTPSPASTATAEASPTPEPTVIEIGWVGDLTPGSKYGNPPNEGRALFEHTRNHLLEPDLMIANLEGTFGTGGASKCDGKDSSDCYAFQAPPANAASLAWAGIDVANLANNHSNDYFGAGLTTTKEALAANGVDYTGLDGVVARREIDGVTVAVVGFSPYSWSPNIGDLAGAEQLVREIDETADVVVVVMHAGAEGADKTHVPQGAESAYGEFRGDSRAFSRAVIDAGADLVVGSGPHVVRGMEWYKDRLIAYSLGNFAGWRNFNRSGALALSGLLTVRMDESGGIVGGRWLSLRIHDPGVPKPDPQAESAALVQRLSGEDFTDPVLLGPDGSFSGPAE